MAVTGTLLAHESNYARGRRQAVRYLVIHYTGNKGDTARGNCLYFQGADRGASAHYFVDEDSVWRSVPEEDTAWHCGTSGAYRHPDCRNANSIGIELCSDWADGEYILTPATVARGQDLARTLMKKYGIDAAHVLRHYDVTGKVCPRPFVESAAQWETFLDGLEDDDMDIEALTDQQLIRLAERMQSALDARPISDTLASELEQAKAAGITDGTGPSRFCTRAQAAVMVKRAFVK